jgi:1-acyl-sn-glycerol-3-phosphate acyltransferase
MWIKPGRIVYWLGYYFLKVSSWLWFPFTAIGQENIPAEGGFIFASNHLSNLDPLLIGLSIDQPTSYMAKDSLFKNRAFGFFLRRVWTFPVKRGTADIGALKEALKRLKNGSPLVLFPQGTRRRAGERDCSKLHPGVGFIASRSGVPVVPVLITGSDQVLPPGAKWFHRHPICLVFGKPLHFSSHESPDQIVHRIMEAVFSLQRE